MMGAASVLLAGGVAAVLAGALWAQTGGIYTCTDASGRRITSDRPNVECADREQKELNPSGTVRRTVRPPMTADEQLRAEEARRQQDEARQRQLEERRRDQALLARYPNREAHDHQRADAMVQIDAVVRSAQARLNDLVAERIPMQAEADRYKADPARMPAALARRLEANQQTQDAQARFLQSQMEERRRLNARYDEELAKLQKMWAP